MKSLIFQVTQDVVASNHNVVFSQILACKIKLTLLQVCASDYYVGIFMVFLRLLLLMLLFLFLGKAEKVPLMTRHIEIFILFHRFVIQSLQLIELISDVSRRLAVASVGFPVKGLFCDVEMGMIDHRGWSAAH